MTVKHLFRNVYLGHGSKAEALKRDLGDLRAASGVNLAAATRNFWEELLDEHEDALVRYRQERQQK